MPVSVRARVGDRAGQHRHLAASCSACATRWASSAWIPGQAASISTGPTPRRRGVALARRLDVAAHLARQTRER